MRSLPLTSPQASPPPGLAVRAAHYLVWTDAVAWISIGILVMALAETLVVHWMIRTEYRPLGVAVDKAMRVILPSVHVLILSILLLAGKKHTEGAVVVGVFGFGGVFAYGYWYICNEMAKNKVGRSKVVRRLNELTRKWEEARDSTRDDHDRQALDKQINKGLKDIFNHLDADGSGSLSRIELERLLRMKEPYIAKADAGSIVGNLTCFIDLDNGCTMDEFADALQEMEAVLSTPHWRSQRLDYENALSNLAVKGLEQMVHSTEPMVHSAEHTASATHTLTRQATTSLRPPSAPPMGATRGVTMPFFGRFWPFANGRPTIVRGGISHVAVATSSNPHFSESKSAAGGPSTEIESI